MSAIKVRFMKLHPDAVAPKKKHGPDAGYDLTAVRHAHGMGYIEYHTGLAISIPEGYVGLLFPRSSISKTPFILSNCVGVLDSGYIGEVTARFKITDHRTYGEGYAIGDRILQLVVLSLPEIELEEVSSLEETERGTGGYGSTGK